MRLLWEAVTELNTPKSVFHQPRQTKSLQSWTFYPYYVLWEAAHSLFNTIMPEHRGQCIKLLHNLWMIPQRPQGSKVFWNKSNDEYMQVNGRMIHIIFTTKRLFFNLQKLKKLSTILYKVTRQLIAILKLVFSSHTDTDLAQYSGDVTPVIESAR